MTTAANQAELANDYRALMATELGQMVLEAFARKSNMGEAAMRRELHVNAPLVRYYLETIARVMRDDTALTA